MIDTPVKEYGYEYDASHDDVIWVKSCHRTTDMKLWGALALQSGRDALKVVAREYQPTIALLPALSCDSMTLPFTLHGHEVRYYRLKDDYSIDFEHLKTLIPDGIENVLFLYMDYFGRKAASVKDLMDLRNAYPSLVFIEDKTHVFLHSGSSPFMPDYTVVSLRKWLAIPDGGIVWCHRKLHNHDFLDSTEFSERRLEAQCMRHKYLQTNEIELKPLFRRIFSNVSDIMDNNPEPCRMSAYSYELICKTNWKKIETIRESNSSCLISCFKHCEKIRLLQSQPKISDLYVPILVDNRDEIQKNLSEQGIYTTLIWPLSEEQKQVCRIARQTEEQMLAVPCDQRYDLDDMKYIAENIIHVVEELS